MFVAVRNESVDWTQWLMQKKEEAIQGLKSSRRESRMALVVEGGSFKRTDTLYCCRRKETCIQMHVDGWVSW